MKLRMQVDAERGDKLGFGVGVEAELLATLGTDTHPVLQVSDFLFA